MRWTDEQLLAGEPVAGEPELSALISAVRSFAAVDPPPPTPALQRVLRSGLTPARPRKPRRTSQAELRRRRLRRGALSLGLGAKLALGVAAAAAATSIAVPVPDSIREPARSLVTGVAHVVAPWTGGETPDEPPGVTPEEPSAPDRQLGGTPGGSPDQGPPEDRGRESVAPPGQEPDGPDERGGPPEDVSNGRDERGGPPEGVGHGAPDTGSGKTPPAFTRDGTNPAGKELPEVARPARGAYPKQPRPR